MFFRLPAFSYLELLCIIIIVGILASLALPRFGFGHQALCVKQIKYATQFVVSNYSKLQQQTFLLNRSSTPPDMPSLSRHEVFSKNECSLKLDGQSLRFQAGNKHGVFVFQSIAGSYQLRCYGDCDQF